MTHDPIGALRSSGPALPPAFYRLRSVLNGVEHDGMVLDRLTVTWFMWNVSEREDDLARHVEPGSPHAAELMAAVFTVAEADALEGYLSRIGWLEGGLARNLVSLPVPWRNQDGDAFAPIGRLPEHGGAFYGLVWAREDYELPWGVAFYADACDAIDRATGRAPLRPWRPSDGEIVEG